MSEVVTFTRRHTLGGLRGFRQEYRCSDALAPTLMIKVDLANWLMLEESLQDQSSIGESFVNFAAIGQTSAIQ